MAETALVLNQKPSEPKNISNNSSVVNPIDSISTVDDIPTVDYFMLFSDDPDQRCKALEYLHNACKEYGCFYLVNHGVPDTVIEGALKGISDFYDLTEEERNEYDKRNSMDRIRRCLMTSNGENRERLKVALHPQYHCPAKPAGFSETLEEYVKRFQEVKFGLGRAISKILGLEESYIEKVFKLESGFDVAVLGFFPPWFELKGSYGVPAHSDTGFFVSLIETARMTLDILAQNGKWITVNIPTNAMLILLGDHLEILTNGKYKSPIHKLKQDNESKRISMSTIHGPSVDTFVKPAPEFVDESHPPAYRGLTYKESLEANGYDEIDVHPNLEQLRLTTI